MIREKEVVIQMASYLGLPELSKNKKTKFKKMKEQLHVWGSLSLYLVLYLAMC